MADASLVANENREGSAPLEVEWVAVGELELDPANRRQHPEANLAAIAASLERFGQRKPVVVWRGRVMAGNGTVTAARDRLGWSHLSVVRCPDGWDESEARAFAIADNRSGELAVWDEPGLAADLVAVRERDEALFGALGFADEDLAGLLARVAAVSPPVGLTDPDAAPDAPGVAVTARGDVWALGPHRLVCGDCTDPAVVVQVLDVPPALLLTDPPYGVGIGRKNRSLQSVDPRGRRTEDLAGDLGLDEVEELWRAAFPVLADALVPGTPWYMFGPPGGLQELLLLLLLLLRESGLNPRHQLIWNKNHASFSIGRLDYDYKHEPIAYGWKPGAGHPWFAQESKNSVLEFDRPRASASHPTMKPVALLAELVRNSTSYGAVVFDPFAGSGSTLIAAHQEQRVARCIELSERYCDVICRRYQDHTGTLPILERTGATVDFTDD